MKKLFSLACAVLLAISAQAQLVTSRSRSMIDTPKEDRTMWIMRIGVGTNNFVGDDYEDLDSKVGYFFGFEFNREMGRHGAYWGMDFALASRGWKISEKGFDQKFAAHNIHWSPFIFGWKINIPDTKFSIDPHIGVYAACDYAGKMTSEVDGYADQEVKSGDVDDYNRFDVGMKIGVGVWYNKKYNLDFTYQRGFLGTDAEADGGPSNFMVRLGLGF